MLTTGELAAPPQATVRKTARGAAQWRHASRKYAIDRAIERSLVRPERRWRRFGGLRLIENETHLQSDNKRNIDGRFFHLKGVRCGSFALRPAVGSPDVMGMAFPRPVFSSKSTRETSEAL